MDSQKGKKKKTSHEEISQASDFSPCVEKDMIRENAVVLPLDEVVIYPNSISVTKVRLDVQTASVQYAMHDKDNFVVAIAAEDGVDLQRQQTLSDVKSFVPMGTYSRVLKVTRLTDEQGVFLQVTLRGDFRVAPMSLRFDASAGIHRMTIRRIPEVPLAIIGEAVYSDQTLFRSVRQAARTYFDHLSGPEAKDAERFLDQVRDAGTISDFLSARIDMPFRQHVELLCENDVRKRLRILLDILANQLEIERLVTSTAQKVRTDLEKQQRDYFIRQHIKALKSQIEPEPENELDELKKKIEKMEAPEEVISYTLKQWQRLEYMPMASAEYSVARAHIDTLLDMPWLKKTEDRLDLAYAREVLNEDHYGLDKVKERVLEHLAVLALRRDLKSPILCLYGPPGVGKTSIGKSIARALNRKYERISLGGIHDESEIRGHRRTYVASMPGRIVQAIRHAGVMNPVLLLDEIDKLSRDRQGDPSSALLEVLDPEQHNAFVDNYIETPIDLSNVLFITTANSLDTIPEPLRDRMEIIEIPSYTHVDKRAIATGFLIPKLLTKHGLKKSNMTISPEALDDVISHYTREAGVRQLEQRLGSICRKVAARVVEGREQGKKSVHVTVSNRNLDAFLGKKRFEYDAVEPDRLPGISTGLAWTPVGGEILFIETSEMPGKGNLVITGKLGDVMQESVRAAMTLVRAHAEKLGIDVEVFEKRDIHVHVPAGATPKDGPSAGCAIFCAILSLLRQTSVPADLAMTGEVSLRGNVLPVGGIREKVLAAHRAGVRTVILPDKNVADLDEVHESVRNDMRFIPVSKIEQVIENVFPNLIEG